jgi:RNA polymerase sigma-70 factor
MAVNLSPSICRAIEEAYWNGYASHGNLELEQKDFESHIASVVKKTLGPAALCSSVLSFINELHTDDLYLVIACTQRTDVAWERFSSIYGKYIRDLAVFMTVTSNAARELADGVVVNLFLPDKSGRSRIGSYEGRSSLATWLRVIVSHRAMNERERVGNNTESLECIPDIADEPALSRMYDSLRACRFGRIIGDSLQASCQCLTDRERLILILRYDEELQLGQIARMLSVHQSTITRELRRAYKKLREEVIATLLTKHHLNRSAVDECCEDILKNPSYNLVSYLTRSSLK